MAHMTPLRGAARLEPAENSNHEVPSFVQTSQGGSREVQIRRKTIFDRVYGQIQFPPVVSLLIDSPQVQRLRDLKQLGNTQYVYPAGTNTRFEHSLGVAHLAMEFLKQIIANHSEERYIGIPQLNDCIRQRYSTGSVVFELEKDICCVGIAGLCHDLGHGPLSHMFEAYVNDIRRQKGIEKEWSHEEASVKMLKTLWEDKDSALASFGYTEEDFNFIKLCIDGLKPGAPWPNDVGRPAWKRFMTDIVANKRSGLDVDKLDYLQRDSMCCFGIPAFVSVRRLFQGACVMEAGGETQICYQDKLDGTIEEVFLARARQHRVLYQHRVVKVADLMTRDAFIKADKHFMISADGERYFSLSEAVEDPDAYLQTGDWVINAILHSSDSGLADARSILGDIQNRALYKTIGSYRRPTSARLLDVDDFMKSIGDEPLRQHLLNFEAYSHLPAITVVQAVISGTASGMDSNSNPLSGIRFFNPRFSILPSTSHVYEKGRYTTATRWQGSSDYISTVLCRAPCSTEQFESLSEHLQVYIELLIEGEDAEQQFDITPVRQVSQNDHSLSQQLQQPSTHSQQNQQRQSQNHSYSPQMNGEVHGNFSQKSDSLNLTHKDIIFTPRLSRDSVKRQRENSIKVVKADDIEEETLLCTPPRQKHRPT